MVLSKTFSRDEIGISFYFVFSCFYLSFLVRKCKKNLSPGVFFSSVGSINLVSLHFSSFSLFLPIKTKKRKKAISLRTHGAGKNQKVPRQRCQARIRMRGRTDWHLELSVGGKESPELATSGCGQVFPG